VGVVAEKVLNVAYVAYWHYLFLSDVYILGLRMPWPLWNESPPLSQYDRQF